jgi:hypothetical protein
LPLRTFVGDRVLTGLDQLLIAVFVVKLVIAPRALILEPRAILAQDAEIMVRELEVIFGLHAVPGELRVASHILVLLEQLRSIAPLPVVLPVARLAAEILAPLSTAAASAAALTIVDQMPTSLRLVASPFASDGQGCAQASAALTLSFRS